MLMTRVIIAHDQGDNAVDQGDNAVDQGDNGL